ncbi:MAG TPA: DUF6671 family protein [Kofleriaceae bacterium]|nr:DUF6671 family protein [Kofleriaceae bacterium]
MRAVIATRHGKEHVIAHVLAAADFTVQAVHIDTDRFGTFAGDVLRLLAPRDAAIAKARAALAAEPTAHLGIGSEGTFGAVDTELVALVHRSAPLVLVGRATGAIVRHGEHVTSLLGAEDAAERLGFPSAGVLVMTPARELVLREVEDCGDLREAVERTLVAHGAAWIEPDRRAHRDPARREVIAEAARDVLVQLRDRCEACGAPGFVICEHELGLPCEACGAATSQVAAFTRRCWACGHRAQWHAPGPAALADCERCHP